MMLALPSELSEIVEWDRTTEEPNFMVVGRATRTTDSSGRPCSRWEFTYSIEGIERGELSQVQRDYMATFMRQVAMVHQDVNLDEHRALAPNLARIAGMLRAELKATMNMYVKLAEHLVRVNGLNGAASILGLKEHKVRHLLKSRGQMPSLVEMNGTEGN
jgi:hypothetical protein